MKEQNQGRRNRYPIGVCTYITNRKIVSYEHTGRILSYWFFTLYEQLLALCIKIEQDCKNLYFHTLIEVMGKLRLGVKWLISSFLQHSLFINFFKGMLPQK
ncbi:hypothetical protein WUBG_03650 [Wuchereria bancrofti]|uniref:Uncharacterized protein n=1 Tax=Wuchereria bancrofti TaxID=6293 RepID=J9ES89_WUCBA|nr:hypothetical protein WUBG_03650 [Wuchereria bancrofti]